MAYAHNIGHPDVVQHAAHSALAKLCVAGEAATDHYTPGTYVQGFLTLDPDLTWSDLHDLVRAACNDEWDVDGHGISASISNLGSTPDFMLGDGASADSIMRLRIDLDDVEELAS